MLQSRKGHLSSRIHPSQELVHTHLHMFAGAVVASLLPLSSAKPLGVDSAEADAAESESRSGSSADMHGDQDDADDAVAARYDIIRH